MKLGNETQKNQYSRQLGTNLKGSAGDEQLLSRTRYRTDDVHVHLISKAINERYYCTNMDIELLEDVRRIIIEMVQ